MLRGFSEEDPITDCLKLNSIKAEEPSCSEDTTITIKYIPSTNPAYEYLDYLYSKLFFF